MKLLDMPLHLSYIFFEKKTVKDDARLDTRSNTVLYSANNGNKLRFKF